MYYDTGVWEVRSRKIAQWAGNPIIKESSGTMPGFYLEWRDGAQGRLYRQFYCYTKQDVALRHFKKQVTELKARGQE